MALSQKVFYFSSNFQKIQSISLHILFMWIVLRRVILQILAKLNSEINSLLECFYSGNLSGLFLLMKLFERMALTIFYILIQFVHWLQFDESHTFCHTIHSAVLLLYSNFKLIQQSKTKGGLISESFSLWIKSPRKCANKYPDYYPPTEKMLRIVFGTFFWEIWAKVKTFWD